MKRTKIVCTIGPASDQKHILKEMIKNGMNVARLNFSHNTHAYHRKTMRTIRQAAHETNNHIAILQDLQGPRIRLGELPAEGVILSVDKKIILTTKPSGDKRKIPVTYSALAKEVKPRERILIADGLIELKVLAIKGADIYCAVINGGRVTSHKGINLPDTDVKVATLSDKDREDLLFGVKENVDLVALSFVRRAADVLDLKALIKKYEIKLKKKNNYPIKVIVKIERREAIDNLAQIMAAADAVMVARGDLGIEMPTEDVPLLQKMIIDKCLHASKPVIVATQMLDSMINHPRPTRAEANDVANAVIDHTDAVMLSGETATGKFPVETVQVMSKIIEKTEASVYDNLILEKAEQIVPETAILGQLVKLLTENIEAQSVFAASLSGQTGRLISRYRPELPIFVASADPRVCRQLNLSWGIQPFLLNRYQTTEGILKHGLMFLKKRRLIKKGGQLIVALESPNFRNEMRMVEVIKV